MAERLTIDKAIAHAREVARENKYRAEHKSFHRNDKDEISACLQCAEEHEQLAGWLKDLQHYKDLEEQGRLIELPCKIGDTVWETKWWDDITETRVIDGKTYFRRVMKHKVTKSHFSLFDYKDLGKTVFLTKEEAEAALKGADNAVR